MVNKTTKYTLSYISILLGFILTIFISFFVNIYKLSECDFEAPYKCEVLHGVGLVPLFSPIFVWFDIDTK